MFEKWKYVLNNWKQTAEKQIENLRKLLPHSAQLSEVLLMTRKNLLWCYIWMNWAFCRIFGLVAFILVKVGYKDKFFCDYYICLNSSIGRALHFCARGPRFKSGRWHFFLYSFIFSKQLESAYHFLVILWPTIPSEFFYN